MKTRLLPVLLLTATFPFAALAQSTGTNPGGTSSSDTGTGQTSSDTPSSNQNSGPNAGGTSSSDNSGTSGLGGNGGSNTNGTTGGSSTSSSSSGAGGTTSDSGANTNTEGTGALSTSGSAGMASTETFVTIPGSGAWRVSDLQGKPVYSIDGSNIGEINDVLVSQNGSVNAVIIGVGGFLGIGEKNVAVNVSALQMAPSQMTGATGTAGSTDSSNSAGTSAIQSGTAGSDRIVLNVTRDQLEKAPAFTGMNSK